ncbi:MAG: lipid-A-disaccharide synthase N-terminal domain-containing protein [Planctomycetes bacterium]|nr:lipid-A-disaccharide synthase N-terminal domain-containing protein [Planctomycetota bacterium]
MSVAEKLWVGIGFVGQACFFMRFVVQWIASERVKRSVIPDAFWWLSIGGSLILLAYAIYRRDPVFIVAFAPNVLIYSRNLWFLKLERERDAVGAAAAAPVEEACPAPVVAAGEPVAERVRAS